MDKIEAVWSVEVEFIESPKRPSVFHPALEVMLDADYVQIRLLDGEYVAYALDRVRKVLAMRAKKPVGYTGKDLSPDELY